MSMLPGAPWLLAHKSMLPVDRPRLFSLYGRDYVLWRDKNDRVSALPNVCPHMGAMLSAGWCESQADGSSKVVCPFHALEFDNCGRTILPGSGKETLPQLAPLELIARGDFIWSYGGHSPRMPIPTILEEFAAEYEFAGFIADLSVETDLKSMLLNMHDYNHQNGTHRELFKIQEVNFDRFIDNGYHSEAFYSMPLQEYTLQEKLRNPGLFFIKNPLEAHLENYFPTMVILHAVTDLGTAKQCHIFIPEGEGKTRTYVLLFVKSNNPIFKVLKPSFLKMAEAVVIQDADILSKIYPDSPQKIKLNNEVGMDWVRQNFTKWEAEKTTPIMVESA
jgi:phenylpropionate dioxygenase-like ring-hydroxylating dioxygenase large terminal subunit